jgi:hypothetical protein
MQLVYNVELIQIPPTTPSYGKQDKPNHENRCIK